MKMYFLKSLNSKSAIGNSTTTRNELKKKRYHRYLQTQTNGKLT